jgi:branched-chain amino acid transport system permease protein
VTGTWRQAWPWLAFAAVLLLAPWCWGSSGALSLLSQMGIAIVVCLSYHLLLGEGGMLSFGHAVYTGLGSYLGVHTLLRLADGGLPLPVSLVPVVAGLGAAAVAVLLGWVTTRRAGTPFAMITLGIGELVWAASLMFPQWSGGEGGLSADRVVGPRVWGISWGPAIQVYGLVAGYTFLCALGLYLFVRTPLGRLLNAVRDNPERVAYLGFDPRFIRYLALVVSAFFAGVAGGLGALLFEIATPEVLSAQRSGAYLLFTVLGGTALFWGPVLGGVLMVLSLVWLSSITQAWLLYLGLVFMAVVVWAPGGLSGLVLRLARALRGLRGADALRLLGPGLLALLAGALVLLGVGAAVEMLYHLPLRNTLGDEMRYLGLSLHTASPTTWLLALALAALGLGLGAWARRAWCQVRRAHGSA